MVSLSDGRGEYEHNDWIDILRITNIVLLGILIGTLSYFTRQTIKFARAESGGHADYNTLLTFLFMGLLFFVYTLYMLYYNFVMLEGDTPPPEAKIILLGLNYFYYLFQNLSLLFNISRWNRVINRQGSTVRRRILIAFIAGQGIFFFVWMVIDYQPYKEIAFEIAQGLVINPIEFWYYVFIYS